ncbi:hypothetical protein OFO10_00815 [Campylobacter sp. VBCF_06 NA8]|uniref:hypothetical protein n=1 Tax=Campylobacter sp. VBCF_06 NA8 TaxID=2983822 RepID=UPI0022E99746|nr:hypothetical protein [Campylobacter sp. VBCF_06 NA8]MDA3045694.1 hypothetical protein [Campylobacter sp. VBCF_06 NA8]
MNESKQRGFFSALIEDVFSLIYLFIIAAICFPLWEMIVMKHFHAPKLTLLEFFGLCILARCIFGLKF